MTRTVAAAHPAYVAHRPRRSRTVRDALVRAFAPVEIRETDAAGFERPFVLRVADVRGYDVEPWVRDGVTWRPLRHQIGGPVPGGDLVPVTAGDLEEWLRGDVPAGTPLWRGLSHAFNATPLMARMATGVPGEPDDGVLRGLPVADCGLGDIAADEREAMAAAVARFVRDEIVVADGLALMRWRPLVRAKSGFHDDFLAPQLGREVSFIHPPFSPDREAEAAAFAGGHARPGPSEVAALLRGLPGREEGHDLVVAANALPDAFLATLAPLAAGKLTMPLGTAEACAGLADRLAPLARRGSRGLIGAGEAAGAFELMAEAIGTIGPLGKWSGTNGTRMAYERAARYVEAVALPRLRAEAAEDDAEALRGLAP